MTRGMGIAIRARYPARNPGEGEPSGVGEGGWIIASAVDGVAVIIDTSGPDGNPVGWASCGSQRLSGGST